MTRIFGDLNGNGNVNIEDIILALSHIQNIYKLEGDNLSNGMITNNEINQDTIQYILDIIFGVRQISLRTIPLTPTPSSTSTLSYTPTSTPTPTPSKMSTSSPTPSPSDTSTSSPTPSPTPTSSDTSTSSPTPSNTSTPTPSKTSTPTPSETSTSSPTPSATSTSSPLPNQTGVAQDFFPFTGGGFLQSGWIGGAIDESVNGVTRNGIFQFQWDIKNQNENNFQPDGIYPSGVAHYFVFVPGTNADNGRWYVTQNDVTPDILDTPSQATIADGIVTFIHNYATFNETAPWVDGIIPYGTPPS